MHFCIKCICNILCYKMYASLFFAKQKTQHFCIKCIFAQLNIFLWKMYAKMHFAAFAGSIKCICNILCYKMYASNAFLHQQNVMLNILQSKMYALLNIFLWKMYAKMHFAAFAGSIKCICNILCYKMYASLFFAKQKTQHFCIKCIFAQLNIFLWKMYAKMHFGIKCIFASNIFLQSIKCIFASKAFLLHI